jgi:KUP system potassium uptake protein
MRLRERIKNEMMVIKSLGAVYGDIGTSPIYTFAVIFLFITPSVQTVYSVVSMIIWTLILLVSVQYAWLATSLSKRGEGGTIVLVNLLLPYLKGVRLTALVSALGFIGVSLLIGDAVITPAISILSAVEGIPLIPGYENMPRLTMLLIASGITFALFAIQKKGVEKVASAFGPIMVIWFFALALCGGYYILQTPEIINALSPLYAIRFVMEHPFIAFVVLADVILCATGGEALYADMGHMGRTPILKGWIFVFFSLVLIYLGEGAFMLDHPDLRNNPFFEMFHQLVPSLYVLILVLSIMATVIASQSMISGIFSALYQAMTTRIFPHFKVKYTSDEMRSQIYIGSVNWILFVCVIAMLFIFQESAKLAAAFGLAVAGAMSITGVLITMIFMYQKKYLKMTASIITGILSVVFFVSCWLKIPHGGYWSLIIASVPLLLIVLYTQGQKRLYASLIPIKKELFLEEYSKRYRTGHHAQGTALFFARRWDAIPAYIGKTMFQNGIIYDYNIMVIIKTTHEAHGISSEISPLGEGFDQMIIYAGYMEKLDVEAILMEKNINERVIFYGDEEIVSSNFVWKIFALIKDISPNFVSFYNFPHEKLIGVSRRTEI